MNILEVKNLTVKTQDKLILDDVSFVLAEGESLAIMGPNGSGKSTLAKVLLGHPDYQVTSGSILFKDQDILKLKPEERAAAGLFLSFQEPREIAGLDLFSFLFDAYRALEEARGQEKTSVFDFRDILDSELEALAVKGDWSNRQLNAGFSGGEKKKAELLQLALANPKLAILDEIDSGLDVDALTIAGAAIDRLKAKGTSFLVVTHYRRVLDYVRPDKVLVLSAGRVAAFGGPELATKFEAEGFASVE
jgi:Fe-S cluster assembly ATP-binding protein